MLDSGDILSLNEAMNHLVFTTDCDGCGNWKENYIVDNLGRFISDLNFFLYFFFHVTVRGEMFQSIPSTACGYIVVYLFGCNSL